MASTVERDCNVTEVVPMVHVSDMPRSLAFYGEGLGFERKLAWPSEEQIRWCWLTLGRASIMLQTFPDGYQPVRPERPPITLSFICADAIGLYNAALAQGLAASEPQVGNGMWVTSLID